MPVLYIASVDKYVDERGNFYTDDELEVMSRIEDQWRENQYTPTFRELLEIFPDAIIPARRGLKERLKQHKAELHNTDTRQEDYQNNRINKAHFSEQNELRDASVVFFNEEREVTNRKIRSILFNLSYLDELEGKGPVLTGNGVDESRVAQAKQVPITNFYTGKLRKFGNKAVGQCPFHNERTASFTIYTQQNTWWCYGCNTGGSVVDYLMKQNGADFLTTVKTLLT